MKSRTFVTPLAALFCAVAVYAGCAASSSNGSDFGTINVSASTTYGGGTSSMSETVAGSDNGSVTLSTSSSGTPVGGDASAPVAPPTLGNPLCNASRNSGPCYPDDYTTAQACGIAPDGGGALALDAGAPGAGNADAGDAGAAVADAGVACHVAPSPMPEGGPMAVCRAAGGGGDGDACHFSTDCAPSFECVGAGVCRQYCCYAACDTTQFCDIQRETPAAGGLPVPVCMPIHPCTLLGDSVDGGACDSANETCAVVSIVTGNPQTSCVANGAASVGESCDSDHCAGGLMCVGNAGSRRCYQLCHTLDAASDCPASQTCTGGLPLFTDPTTGVCKTPIVADL